MPFNPGSESGTLLPSPLLQSSDSRDPTFHLTIPLAGWGRGPSKPSLHNLDTALGVPEGKRNKRTKASASPICFFRSHTRCSSLSHLYPQKHLHLKKILALSCPLLEILVHFLPGKFRVGPCEHLDPPISHVNTRFTPTLGKSWPHTTT